MTRGWTVVVHGAAHGARVSVEAARRAIPQAEIVFVEAGEDFAGRLQAALQSARGDAVALVEAGYELLSQGADELAPALDGSEAPVTGAIHVESADGVYRDVWHPGGASAADTLMAPRRAGPVWAARREAIAGIGIDGQLPGLELIDAWIALLEATKDRATILASAVARVDATRPSRWHPIANSSEYPAVFERLLRKHSAALDAALPESIVRSEIAFGALREAHFALLRRRDAALAELDRLRASAAHNRAFLAHHGLDRVDWGSFDRVDPVSRDWGYVRGGPVDRRYIRSFIARHSSDVHGCVLEVQEDDFTRLYGGERVTSCEVVDVDRANPRATVISDLRAARELPDARFDCVILTQTAHVIDRPDAVVGECYRILKPGGVLLATFPCVSRICLEYGPAGDFWRMTPAGAETLVRRAFGPDVQIETFGNVQTTMAFLHGLGEHELTEEQFARADPYNPMLVGVRARRAPARRRIGRARPRGVVLLYHRIARVDNDPFDLCVDPERFREHVALLRSETCIVPLDRLLESAPEDLPDRAVALTFDDGYAEHFEEVARLLEAEEVPATFFVTSADLDAPDTPYWWDVLGRAASISEGERRALHDRFVTAALPEREELLRSVVQRTGARVAPGDRLLRSTELRTLAAMRGMSVGAHSVRHLLLTRQTPERQALEMGECRRSLEAVTGRPVPWFAYPYGAVDEATADAARREFAFSFDCTSAAVPVSFDAARVPRYEVKNWPAEALGRRLAALFGEVPPTSPISFLP